MAGKEDSTSAMIKKTLLSDLPVPSSPTECPTPAEAGAMLAKEMNQLSVDEREKVLEDVHGIARAVLDEPLDYVKNSLVVLEEELSKTPNKVAFDLAKFQSKDYVSNEKLRLMFLRAESFDVCMAASRMVRFFDEKYKLFGPEKLTKDIILADLDPGDIAALERGFYQVLPEKDCAGRKVLCFFPKLKVVGTTQNMLRVLYYMLMSSVEGDEEAQRRGNVGLVYCVDGGMDFDMKNVRKKTLLRSALPVRFQSAHVCYNDPLILPFVSLAMIIMGSRNRMRFRSHYGSDEECQSKLSTFGIPLSALPVSPRGNLFNLETHRTFLAMQQSIESAKSKSEGPVLCVAQKAHKKPMEKNRSRRPIINADYGCVQAAPHPDFNFLPWPNCANPWWNVVGAANVPSVLPSERQHAMPPPSLHITEPSSASRPLAKICEFPAKPYVIDDPWPNDVLFGRGKPIQERPGNARFREIIDKHIDKYEQNEKGAKAIASAYIVRIVKEEGGRFLKERGDGGWVEVDEATARAKVGHTFRARRGGFQQATLKKKNTA